MRPIIPSLRSSSNLVAVIGDLFHPLGAYKPVESTQTLEMIVPRVEYRNSPKIDSALISGAYTAPFEDAHGDTDRDSPEARTVRPCFDADESGDHPHRFGRLGGAREGSD